ncbi:hypothetical protein J4G33_16670 [Actinotalea sp. BY-33]|uniref:DUF4232 domain-containing protein n=1 Tax=Actinotalea soli TaxID=2819234 RepID=A0A939RT59_9CELL|nr:hypothetical protein [Actinotalea soli]MBO1753442.1 hypothetical protein [Actinotalea soli]
MSTVLKPVGPQPDRVYWVRRVVVLVLAVLLVVVASFGVRALVSGGSAEETPAAEGSEGAPTEDGAAEEGGAGGAPISCDPGALTATLATDAQSYPAESAPVLTLTVTNTGEAACTVEVGSETSAITITSGSDRIWASTDCEAEVEEPRLLLLDPGAQVPVERAWSRERSDEECTAGLPEPRPGTYTASATVLGVEVEPVAFVLE